MLKDKKCYVLGVGGNNEENIVEMGKHMKLFLTMGMGMEVIGEYYVRKEEKDGAKKD